ncbi:hypothetical protein KM043_007067 [Ampulex compressa]|nr:hypothetical protein KM043_007067 [Ampulex compressa]
MGDNEKEENEGDTSWWHAVPRRRCLRVFGPVLIRSKEVASKAVERDGRRDGEREKGREKRRGKKREEKRDIGQERYWRERG